MISNGGDVRVRRSRAKLHTAVLALTQSGNPITVGNICATAGVSRATFYRHADSAEGLMWGVLREELDAIRESALGGELSYSVERDIAFEHALVTVVGYVVEHLSGLFANQPRPAAALFADHLYESVTEYRRRSGVSLLTGLPTPAGVNPELLEDAAAAAFAHGFVGALTVWLRERGDSGPDHFLAVFGAVAPRWWLSAISRSTGEFDSSATEHMTRPSGPSSAAERKESP